jgi:environmental stress-induced protein Ves
MKDWTLVSLEQQPAQSWRNGGGLTRELLAWPDAANWNVRLSVADVQASGPFSRFDGLERWFAVLEGDGVVLRSDFATHHLTAQSEPFHFDGGLTMDCTLVRGPTRDFNLMALPGRSRMERVRGEAPVRGAAGALLALYTHDAPALLHGAGGSLELPAYHLAWMLSGDALQAGVRAEDALWMEALT